MTESALQRDILTYLRQRGIPHARMNAGRVAGVRLAPVGWPDIVCCYKGHFVAIECKGEGGRMLAKQDEVLAWLVQNGALVVVAWSVRDVEKSLE